MLSWAVLHLQTKLSAPCLPVLHHQWSVILSPMLLGTCTSSTFPAYISLCSYRESEIKLKCLVHLYKVGTNLLSKWFFFWFIMYLLWLHYLSLNRPCVYWLTLPGYVAFLLLGRSEIPHERTIEVYDYCSMFVTHTGTCTFTGLSVNEIDPSKSNWFHISIVSAIERYI